LANTHSPSQTRGRMQWSGVLREEILALTKIRVLTVHAASDGIPRSQQGPCTSWPTISEHDMILLQHEVASFRLRLYTY
jgi:hypothetical protein